MSLPRCRLVLRSLEFDRYFRESQPFNYLLNLSAIKHVRSEKNIYCLMRMIDRNAVFLYDSFTQNSYRFRRVPVLQTLLFEYSHDRYPNLRCLSEMLLDAYMSGHAETSLFCTP